jgi:hypothetical protein
MNGLFHFSIVQQSGFDLIDLLFVIRLIPLILAGFVATRGKNAVGFGISALYLSVTTVNYIYKDPSLNAIFSTPLVFLTAWYIIKHDIHNKRNRGFKLVKKEK